MTMKHKKNSRLLEAIHETANDFHNSGAFNQEQMQKYDALCLSPVSVETAKIPIYLDGRCTAGLFKTTLKWNLLSRKTLK